MIVKRAEHRISFNAFGVAVVVATNCDEARERIVHVLPPGSRPREDGDETQLELTLRSDRPGTYTVGLAEAPVLETRSLQTALDTLASDLRTQIARACSERVFIHAGVVEHQGGALILPGDSFAGKTVLVQALARAGATYYSDEYAVLDRDGFVHPFAKPLSVRNDGSRRDHPIEDFGGVAGTRRVPVRAVTFTTYVPGATWRPTTRTEGEAAIALFAHAVSPRSRAASILRAIGRVIDDAVLLEGQRGEAEELAPHLLSMLGQWPSRAATGRLPVR